MKLKNLKCDETQKLKLWLNSKIQKAMKLKNSNCDLTKKLIVIKLKNSNCDKTWKLKFWWKAKTKKKTSKLKMWQDSKTLVMTKLNTTKCDQTQIVIKLKNSNCDRTSLKFWQNLNYYKSQFIRRKTYIKQSFNKNILTPWQPMRCSPGSVFVFSQCLVWYHNSF